MTEPEDIKRLGLPPEAYEPSKAIDAPTPEERELSSLRAEYERLYQTCLIQQAMELNLRRMVREFADELTKLSARASALEDALRLNVGRVEADGPCWCAMGTAEMVADGWPAAFGHSEACNVTRALLAVKP